MLRLKKTRQERVNLEQTVQRQPNLISADLRQARFDKPIEAAAEFSGDINAEFLAEVRGVKFPGLQLKNHFANQKLMLADRQRAVQRQLAGFEFGDVGFPRIQVLVMHPLKVPERRHARADQIGAAPERIAMRPPAF